MYIYIGIAWRDKKNVDIENKAHLSAVALEKKLNDHFMKLEKK
jgi:hypothetical protein